VCLTGEVGWARLSTPSRAEGSAAAQLGGSTPIALYLRENGRAWHTLRGDPGRRAREEGREERREEGLTAAAQQVWAALQGSGASFSRDLAASCGLDEACLGSALAELVGAGLITSDGFAGLRAVIRASGGRPAPPDSRTASAGRWSRLEGDAAASRDEAIDVQARSFLRRYGVVFRRLLVREATAVTWRELTRVYRRLEARGEIRGGRFVSGMAGEQFALPDAVVRLREVRRTPPDGCLVTLSAADPLNLTGVITAGERVRTIAGSRVVYRDGIPLAALEGEYMRPLTPAAGPFPADVVSALAGRRLPAVAGGFVGRAAALTS
jgi:ATP-dependent helicase Lhr and Lhr-like helicase